MGGMASGIYTDGRVWQMPVCGPKLIRELHLRKSIVPTIFLAAILVGSATAQTDQMQQQPPQQNQRIPTGVQITNVPPGTSTTPFNPDVSPNMVGETDLIWNFFNTHRKP